MKEKNDKATPNDMRNDDGRLAGEGGNKDYGHGIKKPGYGSPKVDANEGMPHLPSAPGAE